MNKKILFFILFFASITTGMLYITLRKPHIQEVDKEYILSSILNDIPAFSADNRSLVKIDSVAKFEDKWYIINISSLRETKVDVPVKLVLLDTGTDLQIMLGPDTDFTEAELLQYNVPDSVILGLQK